MTNASSALDHVTIPGLVRIESGEGGLPRVVITPYTAISGVLAPKICAAPAPTVNGFSAIMGGSVGSGIFCNWIAVLP